MSSSYKIPMVVAMAGLTVFMMSSPKTPHNRLFATVTAASLAFMLVKANRTDDDKSMSPLYISMPPALTDSDEAVVAPAPILTPAVSVTFRNEIQEPTPIRSPIVTNNQECEELNSEEVISDDITSNADYTEVDAAPFPFSLITVITLYMTMLVCANIAWGVSFITSYQ